MKSRRWRLAVSFVLSLCFIYLTDLFTQAPGRVSGNGNLGLIPFAFAICSFTAYSIVAWGELIALKPFSNKVWKLFTAVFVLLLGSTWLEISFITEMINRLGGPPSEPDSEIYRFGWLNQGTNTLFINLFTFTMLNCFIAIAYCLHLWFYKRKKN